MLRICFKAIKEKGSTVVHLQYRQSSARWHPNYINSCLFCVLRHKTWLQIDRKVRGKTALSSKLQTVFNWIQADNRAKVHLPGFPTLKLPVSLLPLQEFTTSQPELSLVDSHNGVRLGDSRQPSYSENQYSSEAVNELHRFVWVSRSSAWGATQDRNSQEFHVCFPTQFWLNRNSHFITNSPSLTHVNLSFWLALKCLQGIICGKTTFLQYLLWLSHTTSIYHASLHHACGLVTLENFPTIADPSFNATKCLNVVSLFSVWFLTHMGFAAYQLHELRRQQRCYDNLHTHTHTPPTLWSSVYVECLATPLT